MLEVKNLVKTYSSKKGVAVHALDGVTVKFPETGMVFLVGKSGSGKSTLLNVAGGLDTPTDGEVIVNGRSSKTFSQSDFDSYRNTFVGFVFQEYNILDEFTIAQNVELALQLQNKPSDKNAVNELLEKVDLGGLGKRKPNTLSGGQRQRVAIARALIKNPKIIMADEPTGALDANTGRQIFDTLKKLSKTRLVLIVSHDKEFAREYADRIIELVDGKISSDTRVDRDERVQENVRIVNDTTVSVRDWNSVTEQDISRIVSVMKKNNKETLITSDQTKIKQVKQLLGVKEEVLESKEVKEEKIEKGEKSEFIKSRLPFRHAIKMAFGVMKTKPIRLGFTILLSVIAFTFFGIFSSLMLYNPHYSIATALVDSDYEHVAIQKEYQAYFTSTHLSETGRDYVQQDVRTDLRTAFTVEELNRLNQNQNGLNFAGIIDFGSYRNQLDSVGTYSGGKFGLDKGIIVDYEYQGYFAVNYLCGFSDCGKEFMDNNGFELLAGRYPETAGELAIPEYVYDYYRYAHTTTYPAVYFDFKSPQEIIGAPVTIGDMKFTICGVYDVGEIPEKYKELLNKDTKLDFYAKTQLASQLKDVIEYSFHTVGFVSSDFYGNNKYDNVVLDERSVAGFDISQSNDLGKVTGETTLSAFTPKSVWQYGKMFTFYNLGGQKIDQVNLQEKQMFLPAGRIIALTRHLKDAITEKGLEERPDCLEYMELLEKFTKNYRQFPSADCNRIIELIYSLYPEMMERQIELPSVYYAKNLKDQVLELEVVGFYVISLGNVDSEQIYYLSDELLDNYSVEPAQAGQMFNEYKTDYKIDWEKEKYGYLITKSQNTMEQSYFILQSGQDGATYAMTNLVFTTTKIMADMIYEMKIIFSIATVVFGAFAMLMLFNFISVSIQSKKKEIGILRAVGARRVDVFKIFITEALFITLMCFVLSTVLSAFSCMYLNVQAVETGVKISMFNYGIENVLMSLGMVLGVSAIATGIPVVHTSRKSPVESIRAL